MSWARHITRTIPTTITISVSHERSLHWWNVGWKIQVVNGTADHGNVEQKEDKRCER